MIKHANLRFGILVAVGFAVGLAANQTKPPVNRTMKLTGCIERGQTASGSSTVVPPGTPAPPPMYKLTHVDANSLKNAMTSEDTVTAAGVASATEIALRSDSTLKIADHVDHKVELTGKVVTDKQGSKASGRSAADASAAGMSVVPVFQVTNLKMVASSCQ